MDKTCAVPIHEQSSSYVTLLEVNIVGPFIGTLHLRHKACVCYV